MTNSKLQINSKIQNSNEKAETILITFSSGAEILFHLKPNKKKPEFETSMDNFLKFNPEYIKRDSKFQK